jgi:hypothetical protein
MAFGLNLTWEAATVNSLVDAGYDLWSIEKEEAGPTWVPIAPLTVTPPLVSDMTKYVFQGMTADSASIPTMRARGYRSSDSTYSATEFPVTVSLGGYCTIQDVRDQGWDASLYTDNQVLAAINYATNLIDRITRIWFEPRYRKVSMDGQHIDQLFLKVPIVAVMVLEIDETVQALEEFVVYNRHLTHGIVNPDDRADPRVAWGEARSNVDIRRLYGGGRFAKARKSVVISGIYGYTEHGPGDYAGETVKGNQIPVSYGSTPEPIKQAALRLAIRYMQPIDEGDETGMAGKVIEEKTRDQSYKLGTPSESDSSYGLTGDIEVDKILQMYPAPLDVGVV